MLKVREKISLDRLFLLIYVCLVKINIVCLRVNKIPNDMSVRVKIFDSTLWARPALFGGTRGMSPM